MTRPPLRVGSAARLYTRFGFADTGELEEVELVMGFRSTSQIRDA